MKLKQIIVSITFFATAAPILAKDLAVTDTSAQPLQNRHSANTSEQPQRHGLAANTDPAYPANAQITGTGRTREEVLAETIEFLEKNRNAPLTTCFVR